MGEARNGENVGIQQIKQTKRTNNAAMLTSEPRHMQSVVNGAPWARPTSEVHVDGRKRDAPKEGGPRKNNNK